MDNVFVISLLAFSLISFHPRHITLTHCTPIYISNFQVSKMKFTTIILPIAIPLIGFFARVNAGPVAYGTCQAGCAAVVCPCYAAAGCVFGTVLAVAAPAAVAACNTGFGICSAKCAIALLMPTP